VGSRSEPAGELIAARCTTASARAEARLRATRGASVISTSRSMPITVCPDDVSAAVSRRPTNPAAPVIQMRTRRA